MGDTEDCMLATPLPRVVEWKVGAVVLTSLPLRPDGAPEIKASVRRNWVPHGAEGWRLPGESDWRSLLELPPAWGLRVKDGAEIDLSGFTEDEAEEWQSRKGKR